MSQRTISRTESLTRIPDTLSPGRSIVWCIFVFAIFVAPTATALPLASNSELDSPLTIFSLGFVLPSALGPLLAAMLYVVPFSGQVVDGWLAYTCTRRSGQRTLRRHALLSAGIPFVVFAGGTIVLGVMSFVLGPFGLDGGRASDAGAAMFTQIMAVNTPLYVLVFALWQGLWAAIFSVMSYLILLLTKRRALAFSVPLITLWLDNVALDLTDNALIRTVSSIDPFSVVQAPIWVAVIPLLWWFAALIALCAVLRSRGLEVPAFR